jgi:hypothetical protein
VASPPRRLLLEKNAEVTGGGKAVAFLIERHHLREPLVPAFTARVKGSASPSEPNPTCSAALMPEEQTLLCHCARIAA